MRVRDARVTVQRVRGATFRRSWWSGVDGREVRLFLRWVADEWDVVARELAAVREENARLKTALRDWQSAVGVARVRR